MLFLLTISINFSKHYSVPGSFECTGTDSYDCDMDVIQRIQAFVVECFSLAGYPVCLKIHMCKYILIVWAHQTQEHKNFIYVFSMYNNTAISHTYPAQ